MIDGLVLGKLHAKPVARTSRNGNAFVTVALLVAMPDGATLYVSGCAFDGEARRALLALDKGDSVALTDPLAIGLFQPDDGAPPRPSVSVTIQAVLSPLTCNAAARQPAPPVPPVLAKAKACLRVTRSPTTRPNQVKTDVVAWFRSWPNLSAPTPCTELSSPDYC
jgi:hypothetical protein